MLTLQTTIRLPEETEHYQRCLLVTTALNVARGVALKYKARAKLVDALKACDIYISFQAPHRIYLSWNKGVDWRSRVHVELFEWQMVMSSVQDILSVLEREAARFTYRHVLPGELEPGLYKASQEIEQWMGGEMTANEWTIRKQAMVMALRVLTDEVSHLQMPEVSHA